MPADVALPAASESYGRLTAFAHVAGYTFERACNELETLLANGAWQLGGRFSDVNSFLRSVRLDDLRATAEQRKRIAARIKELNEAASNRAIADMLGVGETTVRRDTAPNGAPGAADSEAGDRDTAPNGAPSGAEVAHLVQNQAAREERKTRKAAAKENLLTAEFSEDGPFDVVVIDPPWEMEKIDRDVRPNQDAFDYPTMSVDQLIDFWRADITPKLNPDAHVFMWTTQKHLPAAINLLACVGLRYVLTMVWHKPGGFQPIDLPQYNCEFAIYARQGTPRFVDTKAFPCCFDAPRREHSRKPDEFYNTIRRVTGGSRIDVFSREPREGFAQFGNEMSKFAEVA